MDKRDLRECLAALTVITVAVYLGLGLMILTLRLAGVAP